MSSESCSESPTCKQVEQAIRYAHNVGFDEGYKCGYKDGYNDARDDEGCQRKLRYLSLFSGIEAASLAFEEIGWEPIAFCEIDEFPAAVLANRWPDVPNLGNITKVDWSEFLESSGRPDVLVGGSPCTSFSIAGGRESLHGESRLMFEYCRAVRETKPDWFIWENVSGCLNTRDNAFGQLLHEMEDIGYKDICWRVLDAQFARVPVRNRDGEIERWFGPVAQRRRRVFLIGHLGDGFASTAVCFEPESLRGDFASSGVKRKELAAEAQRSAGNDCASGAIAFAQNQREEVRYIGGDGTVSSCLSAQRFGTYKNETLVCMASGQANAEIVNDGTSPTITCLHEQPIVCVPKGRS